MVKPDLQEVHHHVPPHHDHPSDRLGARDFLGEMELAIRWKYNLFLFLLLLLILLLLLLLSVCLEVYRCIINDKYINTKMNAISMGQNMSKPKQAGFWHVGIVCKKPCPAGSASPPMFPGDAHGDEHDMRQVDDFIPSREINAPFLWGFPWTSFGSSSQQHSQSDL